MNAFEILDSLKPSVGKFLQLPDEEKINYISENWSFLRNTLTPFDILLLQAQEGQGLRTVSQINVWRRLLLSSKIHGLDFALEEHNERMKYFQGVLKNFVEASTLSQKREIIVNEPDLLTSIGTYILQKMVDQSIQDSIDSGHLRAVAQRLSQHMLLLIRCTEFGVELPFEEIKNGRDDYWNPNP